MAKAHRPELPPENLPGDAAPATAGTAADQVGGMAAFESGRETISAVVKTMPNRPGVYRMLDDKGEPIYVGKAKNLKRRVASYVKLGRQHPRTLQMVSETRAMEVVTTRTEVEALLLESNLIKRLKPRYNILLRDDKSFPFIVITGDHEWAQLTKHRGARSRKGEYFGPFASAGAVNRTLNTLQKAFPLRSCSDSIFENRTRPCLQYQIRRCTAPCVGRIEPADYQQLVDETRDFLSGKSDAVQKRLSDNMAAASDAMEFEIAGAYRDRLRALSHIQSHQGINVSGVPEADVIAIHQEAGHSCIQVFFFRAGQNWGNRAFFPSHGAEAMAEEVMTAFIGQFYDNKPAPKQILLNLALPESALLSDALSVKAERRVAINAPQRGIRRDLVDHATLNARDALGRRLAESASQRILLENLAEVFNLDATPQRVEVYDNSHTMGANAIGAMIVAGANGYLKNAYRKFNIKSETLTPGDDYAMMREVLTRRFARLLKADADDEDEEAKTNGTPKENRRIAGVWPDLVLIDGGPGQLSIALEVFADLGVNDVAVAGIAKGPDRDAGREKIYRPGLPVLELPPRDPTLYFLQRLRDEAHRFAIGTHRARRAGAMTRSALDSIAGVGARRKRALLNRFGSVREIERAGLSDLAATEGISGALAEKIYAHFHDDA